MDTINIGGQDRPVLFNFNAYEEIEEKYGIDLLGGVDKTKIKAAKLIKSVAFVGLKYGLDETGKTNPDFDIQQVWAWIKPDHTAKFFAILNKQADSGTKEEKPGESIGDNSVKLHTGV